MAKIKVKLNSAEVVRLLQGQGRYSGVRSMLESRMGRVESQIEPAHLFTSIHGPRVVVQVISDKPGALAREARTGDLARAFDAAGGA